MIEWIAPLAAAPAKSAAAIVTEPTLVDRLRRGDPTAVALAYDQHHQRIRAFARRLVGDDAAAEDLLQEVFVTLPKAIRRFRDESSLGTFLMAVAINHSRHYVRAAARRRRAMDRYGELPETPSGNPERDAAQRQLAATLLRALDQLPMDQRVAFVLLEVEERTSVEASRLVGVPEATMRTRLFHARRKLREYLTAEGYDDFQ